jgi:Niemann-Pick C2 protein
MDVSNCSSLPCTFYKQQTYSVTIQFVTNANTPSAKNLVYGIIAGVPVPFPLPQADVCKNNVTCPLVAGTTYTESLSLSVLSEYPTVRLFSANILNLKEINF